MNREIIKPSDEAHWLALRTQDITSTDIAALFGISPYLTKFELFHRKKNADLIALEPTERMKWGVRLQDAIAAGICQDQGWEMWRRKDEYVRIPELAIGASFDFEVGTNGDMPLLEIKNVDALAFKEGWLLEGDNVEAPPHIELQLQHQMLVAERPVAYIGALVGGNRVTLIKREADGEIQRTIQTRVAQFWESIKANHEPSPNFKEDAKFIAHLNSYAEPGKVMNAAGDDKLAGLVRDYKEWGAKESSAKAEKEGIKAQILTLIEDHEKVIGDSYTISAGVKPPTLIEAYERKGYRDFRIFVKKEKEQK